MKIYSLLLLFVLSCAKVEDCKEMTVETYSNYDGYFNYCRFGTNEIDLELKLKIVEKKISCQASDILVHKQTNCPRLGVITYDVRIITK